MKKTKQMPLKKQTVQRGRYGDSLRLASDKIPSAWVEDVFNVDEVALSTSHGRPQCSLVVSGVGPDWAVHA
jgi:hypothetical protein